MSETDTYSPWISLEKEGVLLLLAVPVVLILGSWLSFTVHHYVGPIPFLVWFIWFTAWASKGGIPPRF